MNEDKADAVTKALLREYLLGQRFWEQADSRFGSDNLRAEGTHAQYKALVEEMRAIFLHEQASNTE